MAYPVYCDECLVDMHEDNFDYRFDYPVCFECVEKLHLEPESDDEYFSDDFPMSLEYDEGGY